MMRICLIIAIAIAWGILPQDQLSANEIAKGYVQEEFEFELVGTQIILDAIWINDKGPFRFQLDTGAEGMGRIDAALVKKLGLSAAGKVPAGDTSTRTGQNLERFNIASLKLGNLDIRNTEMLSRDYNSPRAVAARGKIDGIIGIGMFRRNTLLIDYSKRRLRVSNQPLPPAGTENVLPMVAIEPVPKVKIELGGQTHTAYIDTGAMTNILVPASIAEKLAFSTPPTVVGRAESVSGTFELSMGVLDGSLQLGGTGIANPRIIIAETFENIILGAPFLGQFAITIDQVNSRIRFDRQ